MRSVVGLLALIIAPTLALAAPAKDSERKGKNAGGPDWSEQVVKATGLGAPNLNAANPASARLLALKAAEADALRNILSQVKGVRVSGGATVGDKASSDPELSARVDGTVRGFHRVGEPRYFSDGAVEVDVEVKMSDVVADLLEPEKAGQPDAKLASVPTSGAMKNSGLVIDAKSLKVDPALEPRILDEKGQPVYGPEVVGAESMKKVGGLAGYLKSVDEAKKNARVGDKPLVVKAVKAQGSDVVISQKDADALRDPKGNVGYLSEARVIIVTD